MGSLDVLESPSIERVDIRYEPVSESIVRCTILVNDVTLFGRAAELRVVRKVVVNDERPVNVQGVVLQRKIERLQARNVFEVHRANLPVFSYAGSKIDIDIVSEVEIDDGLLIHTKISQEQQMAFTPRPQVDGNAKEIIEPADEFDFMANLAALPAGTRAMIMALVAAGAILIAINSAAGLHDQFVPERAAWFYDQHSSRGRTELPLYKSLAGSGALGAGLWWMIRRQLRKYMKLELHGIPKQICRADTMRASNILRGRSRVPLENVLVRIVACNMEMGQYVRSSGRSTRKVSFKEPTRAVVLFEQRIDHIPPHARVEAFLKGDVVWERMFRALYPPQLVGKHHGLAVYWEVQLIHQDFVDQEVIGPVECFPWKDFMTG